jgi:hypothetical protein
MLKSVVHGEVHGCCFKLNGFRCLVKKLLLLMSLLLFGVGLAMLLDDVDTFYRYGVHSNELASITEEGFIINWPTGEVPWFAQVSIRSWVAVFWLSGTTLYGLRFCIIKGAARVSGERLQRSHPNTARFCNVQGRLMC